MMEQNSGISEKRAGPVPIEDGAASVVEAAMPTANVAGSVELPKPSKICTTEPDFYEWKDITSEFFESVKELSLGELIHHQKLFGLFEAMSAIEMMDPKMDAGMCCNKFSVPLTYEVAVQTDKIKLISLEPSELIGIMDGIYACLVSWLDGHSLAQTLFTCLYLHQPHSIEDRSLRAFCCAIHKLTQIIRKFVLHAKVFEEEDFDPRDYNYVLTPDIANTKACFMLKEAEDELTKKAKAENAAGDVPEEIQAIVSRLRFLRLLLQALITLWPNKNISPNEQEMVEIVRILNGAIDVMPLVKRTVSLGTQPDPKSDAPNPIGFSPMVNQRILPPTFPRYTKIKDRQLSMNFLEELAQRTKQACKIINCSIFHNALTFFIEFSKKSGPCLLSRSVLQCLYFPQPNTIFGTTLVTDMLRESAKAFCAPPELTSRTLSAHAKYCIDTFFNYCMNMYSFIMYIQICGYNRARQRDKLARLLDDFGNLQEEAEKVDTYLFELQLGEGNDRRPYFSTWILYHCLRAMSMYLLSGLELELYSVHEYMYIYWYLSEYLYNWIITTLTRAECLAEQGKCSSKSKKAKPKKKPTKIYCREIMFSQALKNMFFGYYSALAGFTKDNRIPQPLSMFDNEQIRFDHRFSPFYGLTTPPPVPYIQFSEYRAYTLKNTSQNLYTEASSYFHRARTILEVIPSPDAEITDIIQIAKVNYVVMNLLAKGHKKDSKLPPVFDFTIHKYFPTIKQN